MKILIVEHDAKRIAAAKAALSSHELFIAKNRGNAEWLLQKEDFDLAIIGLYQHCIHKGDWIMAQFAYGIPQGARMYHAACSKLGMQKCSLVDNGKGKEIDYAKETKYLEWFSKSWSNYQPLIIERVLDGMDYRTERVSPSID